MSYCSVITDQNRFRNWSLIKANKSIKTLGLIYFQYFSTNNICMQTDIFMHLAQIDYRIDPDIFILFRFTSQLWDFLNDRCIKSAENRFFLAFVQTNQLRKLNSENELFIRGFGACFRYKWMEEKSKYRSYIFIIRII